MASLFCGAFPPAVPPLCALSCGVSPSPEAEAQVGVLFPGVQAPLCPLSPLLASLSALVRLAVVSVALSPPTAGLFPLRRLETLVGTP